MVYADYPPSADLSALVKLHWTLEVSAEASGTRQRVLPDGCLDMIFILGDDIRRVTPEGALVRQPRAMLLGQLSEPFEVEPEGHVLSFAVRFYPHGFGSFVNTPLKDLANKETPLRAVFGPDADVLQQRIIAAANTAERIVIAEEFLLQRVGNATTADHMIVAAVDAIMASRGSTSVGTLVAEDPAKRRMLERKFREQVGVSPKQLCKVVRLQTVLRLLLDRERNTLTRIAYESEYYDQAHFSKDFKEFTGMAPTDFLGNDLMALSAVLYNRDHEVGGRRAGRTRNGSKGF